MLLDNSDKYLSVIEEKQLEINRLQSVINNRKQLYEALNQKDVRLQDAIGKIGNNIEWLEKKAGEIVSTAGSIVKIAKDYDSYEKSFNKKLPEIKEEI